MSARLVHHWIGIKKDLRRAPKQKMFARQDLQFKLDLI